MVDDWTMNFRPDLLTFVPYEWSFNIILRDFEMVWLGNQHNWIECASNRQENGMHFKHAENITRSTLISCHILNDNPRLDVSCDNPLKPDQY